MWADENGNVYFGDELPENIKPHDTLIVTEQVKSKSNSVDHLKNNHEWYEQQYRREAVEKSENSVASNNLNAENNLEIAILRRDKLIIAGR